jgi:NitT/TauT family transport system ATP-binding protein
VLYRGRDITSVNTSVGYITQSDALLPWATLAKNVEVALTIRHLGTPAERKERVRGILDRVGLSGFGDYYPAQLSGGMRKRTTLARTLVYDPETILMDEPFGALDAQMRMTLQSDLLNLWGSERTKTILFVTHDLEEALLLGDEIVVLGANPGRVISRIQVSLARPRSLLKLRTDPEFGRLWADLWELIAAPARPD